MAHFIDTLYTFAHNTQHIDDEIESFFKKAINKFLKQSILDGYHYEVLFGEKSNGRSINLERKWGTATDQPLVLISKEDGHYLSQGAYCYVEKKEIWITSNDPFIALQDSKEFVEHIHGINKLTGLPMYRAYPGETSKTSIIKLLCDRKGIPRGIWTLESESVLPYSKKANDALTKIAKSISAILITKDEMQDRIENLRSTLSELENEANNSKNFSFQTPVIFCGYPGNNRSRSNEIVAIIEKAVEQALNKLKKTSGRSFDMEYFTVEDWGKQNESGSIEDNIYNIIDRAAFGIIYYSEFCSEESSDGPIVYDGMGGRALRFTDNMNVLFEAGMLHARFRDSWSVLADWFSLREVDSDKVPFNISHIIRVDVKRDPVNKISNEQDIINKLADRIFTVINK